MSLKTMVHFGKSKAAHVTWKNSSPLSQITHADKSNHGRVEACQGNNACPTEISENYI